MENFKEIEESKNKTRVERLKELLSKEITVDELKKLESDKQEQEEKRLEKIQQQDLKNKSKVNYEKFMNLENSYNENGTTQILIVRDEIYLNKSNSFVNPDYILQYHKVRDNEGYMLTMNDENTYIHVIDIDDKRGNLSKLDVRGILEDSYKEYINNHPFKDIKQDEKNEDKEENTNKKRR